MINCCQINVNGLSAHSKTALDYYIHQRNLALVALQETGQAPPRDVFSNLETFGVSHDRGVTISLRKSFQPHQIRKLETPGIAAVFVVANLNNKPIMVASAYRTPGSQLEPLLDTVKHAWDFCNSSNIRSLVVFGDFNSRAEAFGDRITNSRGKQLINFCNTHHAQIISPNAETFVCPSGGSIIDVVLTFGDPVVDNYPSVDKENAHTLFTGAPIRGHFPVLTHLSIADNSTRKRKVFDYSHADWESWQTSVEANIPFIGPEDRPGDLFKNFLAAMDQASELHIPTKTICKHSKPFWTEELTILAGAIKTALNKFKYRRNPSNQLRLEEAKQQFKETLLKEKNSWIHSQLCGLNVVQSNEFWARYRKLFLQEEETFIGCLEDSDGNLRHEECEKEEILFDTFFGGRHLRGLQFDDQHLVRIKQNVAAFSADLEEVDEELDPEENPVEQEEVITAIKSLKSSSSPDCDGIHPRMMKNLGGNALEFLTKLYQRCWDTSLWPWDKAHVTFMKKEGKPSYLKAGAFRPISLSSYVGKVFEKIIDKRIKTFCLDSGLMDDEQEGFLPARSTTRYLYKMLSTLQETRRRKATAFLLLIDFEKAFDSVSHPCLLFKLYKIGVKGKLFLLLKDFLSNRHVRLKVNGRLGKLRLCGETGVPQGAVLSPLFFIIFVSDLLCTKNLPSDVRQNTECFKFADDGSVLVTGEPSQCVQTMGKVLDYINDWCSKWRLVVNCDRNKTEILVIHPRSANDPPDPPQLFLGSSVIQYAEKSKVLGIYLDTRLDFRPHAAYMLKKCWYAWSRLSTATTRMEGINGPSLSLLFRTIVLTKLLYGAPVWLKEQLHFFDDFLAKVRLKITGGQFHCQKTLSELISSVAPLSVTAEVIAVKFALKALTSEDTMTAKILQIESEPRHHLYWQIMATKRYIRWKMEVSDHEEQNPSRSNPGRRKSFLRECYLLDVNPEVLFYTKESMEAYTYKLWDDHTKNSIALMANQDPFTLTPIHTVENLQSLTDSGAVMSCPILNRNHSRKTTTLVADFLHGHCLRFQDFLYAQQRIDRSIHCPECLECFAPDSAFHKLFECQFDGSLKDLRQRLQPIAIYEHNFHIAILFNRDRELKELFCKLVLKVVQLSEFGDDMLI